MSYKLIAADMDGTLLNNAGEITPLTACAVNRAIDAGVLFCVSTGRPIQGVDKFKSVLNLRAPAITYNGAMIVDTVTHEILFEQGLEREDAKKILELGDKLKTTMCIWSGNQLYGNVLDERIHDYKKLSGVEPVLAEDYDVLLEQGITKILWYDERELIEKYQKDMADIDFASVTYCTSKPVFLEFFNSKVSKARAMEWIGEKFGIKRSEMIAVGDGLNDLPMIEYAGLGVAMENAAQAVKDSAQYITLSNENDGIAKMIEEFDLTAGRKNVR